MLLGWRIALDQGSFYSVLFQSWAAQITVSLEIYWCLQICNLLKYSVLSLKPRFIAIDIVTYRALSELNYLHARIRNILMYRINSKTPGWLVDLTKWVHAAVFQQFTIEWLAKKPSLLGNPKISQKLTKLQYLTLCSLVGGYRFLEEHAASIFRV
jgi:hypothetical protein